MDEHDQQPDPKQQRKIRILRILVVLLAVHFICVYAFPQYMVGWRLDQLRFANMPAHPPSPEARISEDDDGTKWLWGGEREDQRFEVTEFLLEPNNLHYGLGREAFPALIEPEFESAESASAWLTPDAAILGVAIDGEAKVYPVELLIRHEVVNDTVGGHPIFAAYCILAELGAVYDRTLGDHTYTFAVSGYTYADPTGEIWEGLDAFVLWDRDTESLWWPPMGKAVSGACLGMPLKVTDHQFWAQTTWGEFRQKHPDAVVLRRNQHMEEPASFERVARPVQASHEEMATDQAIAPRWGENPEL